MKEITKEITLECLIRLESIFLKKEVRHYV